MSPPRGRARTDRRRHSPSSAQSSTWSRPASRPTSSVLGRPPERRCDRAEPASPFAVFIAASSRSRYSALASTSNRPSVSQNVGSPSAARAPAFWGASARRPRRRVSSRTARTAPTARPPGRCATARGGRAGSAAPPASTASSASGSTNATSMRVPPRRADEEELVPRRHGLLDDRRRDRSEHVLLDRPLERARAERRAEALVDQEGVRRLVDLDGPRALAEAAARERLRELLVEKRAHRRPLERPEHRRRGRAG